jgi:phage terminase large subunit-like protein
MAAFVAHRLAWIESARWNQLPPPDVPWSTWVLLAGRGFGKTRCGAEYSGNEAVMNPGVRIALIGPTAADPCRTMVEGESGLLSVLGREGDGLVKKWNRSTTELFLTNGSMFKGFSSEEPENLRGPQHHLVWSDELCAWKNMQDTYDMAKMGLRLGADPKMVVTTTPKPSKLLKGLINDPTTILVRGSTYENSKHLPQSFFDDLKRRYEGTRLGAQELLAQILENFDDAFLKHEEIRHVEEAPECGRIVVGVDPAGTHRKSADYTGIIAAGIEDPSDPKTDAFVLGDYSVRAAPEGWAKRAVDVYHTLDADLIVAEKNYGGEMVESVIKNIDPNVPVKLVHASKGKTVRAEPVLMLYQQGRVFHVGHYADLEEQITAFTPTGYAREGSPDRGDALVWALTELMLGKRRRLVSVHPASIGSRGRSPWSLA